jgi:hypothetical protein
MFIACTQQHWDKAKLTAATSTAVPAAPLTAATVLLLPLLLLHAPQVLAAHINYSASAA